MAKTYSCLLNYSTVHSTSRAMSCAMGLVGITNRSHFEFRAYQNTAGTTRSAELRPDLPVYSFPAPSSQKIAQQLTYKARDTGANRTVATSSFHTSPEPLEDDEFGDDDFEDQEVMAARKIGFCYRYRCPNF